MIFSTGERIIRSWSAAENGRAMQIIDPHIHMISRTTDDYRLMAETGIVAVGEPAFCPGTDRQHPQSHLDYFNHLTTFEPARLPVDWPPAY